MILESLCNVYDVLGGEDAQAPAPYGFSRVGVSFALVLSPDGALTNIVDLRSGENQRPQEHQVPFQRSRTSGLFPFFLCDKAEYVFGIQQVKVKDRGSRSSKKGEDDTILLEDEKGLVVVSRRSREAFSAFRSLQHALLDSADAPGVRAFLAFLDTWDPERAVEHPKVREYLDDLLAGGRCVFRVGDVYLHGMPEIQQIWRASLLRESGESHTAQCLISGSIAPISRTHQAIKGVIGAQPSGASLVSFNEQAFCSYDREQSYNAPVSEECEFKYTTALNLLIASPEHRVRIGDATTVFWAQTGDRSTEAIIAGLLDPPDDDAGYGATEETPEEPGQQVIDDRELARIRDVLRLVRQGSGIRQGDLGINPETRCFILGLAPNNARLAIRYWHQDSFGNLVTNLARHHLDLEVDRRSFEPEILPVRRILFETVPKNAERKEPPPGLSGQLMRAVLYNTTYPVQLYTAILNRIRADQYLNRVRAGVIKAYLLRLARARPGVAGIHEEMITVSLNETSPNVPYRLGRLFAVLEKTQGDANRDREVGSTIKNRYFASASATPAVVFPPLIKLAQHHIAKSDWGWKTTQQMEEILSGVDAFPAWLGLEEQGMFMLGYYHQRRALFTKKNGEKGEVTADE